MNKVSLIVSFVTLIVLAAGGFLLAQKIDTVSTEVASVKESSAKVSELEDRIAKLESADKDSTETDEKKTKPVKKKAVEFDPEKMKVSAKNATYKETDSFDLDALGLKVDVEDGKAYVSVKFVEDYTGELYGIDEEIKDQEITGFKSTPTSCFMAIAGQDLSAPVLCFLMEDGTVETLDTKTAFKNKKYASEGALKELKNIVSFAVVSVSVDEEGGYVSSVAIDEDGYGYDIFELEGVRNN